MTVAFNPLTANWIVRDRLVFVSEHENKKEALDAIGLSDLDDNQSSFNDYEFKPVDTKSPILTSTPVNIPPPGSPSVQMPPSDSSLSQMASAPVPMPNAGETTPATEETPIGNVQ